MSLPSLGKLPLRFRVGAPDHPTPEEMGFYVRRVSRATTEPTNPAPEPDLQEKARVYAAVRRVNEYMAVADEIEKELDELAEKTQTLAISQEVEDLKNERKANQDNLRRAVQKLEGMYNESQWVRENLNRADYLPKPVDGAVVHNSREVVPPGAKHNSTRTVYPLEPNLLCLRDHQTESQLAARNLYQWMHNHRNINQLWKFIVYDKEQMAKYRAARLGEGPRIPEPPKGFILPVPEGAPDRQITMERIEALQGRMFRIVQWFVADLKVNATIQTSQGGVQKVGVLGYQMSLVERYNGMDDYTFHQPIDPDVVAEMLEKDAYDWFPLTIIYYMTSQQQDGDAMDQVGYNSTLVNKDNLKYPDDQTKVAFCQMGNGNITLVDGTHFVAMGPNFGLSRGAMVLKVVLYKPRTYSFPIKQLDTEKFKGGKYEGRKPDPKWEPGEWWERITGSVARMTTNGPPLPPRGDLKKKERYPKPKPKPPSWDNWEEQPYFAPLVDAEDSEEEEQEEKKEKPPPKWLEFSMMHSGERMLRDLLTPPKK